MAGGVPEVMLHLRAHGAAERRRAHGDRRHARRDARLVGVERAAAGGARTARVGGGHRSRRRHHGARRGAARRAHQHGRVSARQPRAGGFGDQGDRDRPVGRRRRRRLSASRAGARVHRRARRDPRREGRRPTRPMREGDVIVLIGAGPSGTGMQETAQITTALSTCRGASTSRSSPTGGSPGSRPARASATSVPRRWTAGRSARVRDGDLIEIVIDRNALTGSVNLVGADGRAARRRRVRGAAARAAAASRASRRTQRCPTTRRLWAALQRASGGTWGGCVYDVDRIVAALDRAARDVREELP